MIDAQGRPLAELAAEGAGEGSDKRKGQKDGEGTRGREKPRVRDTKKGRDGDLRTCLDVCGSADFLELAKDQAEETSSGAHHEDAVELPVRRARVISLRQASPFGLTKQLCPRHEAPASRFSPSG